MSTQQVSVQLTPRTGLRNRGDGNGRPIPVVAQHVTASLAPARSRLWTPRHVVVTRSAAERPHTAEILRRVAAAGVDDVEFLRRRPHHGPARRRRARDLRPSQGDPRGRRQPAVEAQAAADPAQRRLACRPRRGLPGALPVLLPRRVAGRAAGHAGLRRPRRDPRRARRVRRQRARHLRHRRPRARGDDVRGLVLHRPAGHRSRTSGPTTSPAPCSCGRRRSSAHGPCSTCRTAGAPGSGRRSTRRRRAVRGRHRPRRGPPGRARRPRPRRLPGGAHDRADHADRRLAGEYGALLDAAAAELAAFPGST